MNGLRDCVGFPIFHLNVCSEFNLPYPFINDSAKDHKFLLNCHIYRFIQHDAYVGAVFNPREDLLSAHISQRGLKLCCLVVVSVASTSTPYQLKTLFQYDSPVLWPTLLPESPALESTTLSNTSGASDEAANSSGVTGSGQHWGGKDGRHLLAFSIDSSADLSWSSSMATPPSTDLKKNPTPYEVEKEKGIVRALFTPNNSAEDSELGETSMDMTVEQEEASMTVEQEEASTSLFATDLSLHTASPDIGGEHSVCVNCTAAKGYPGPSDASPCSCGRRGVMEIHCTDGVTRHKLSPGNRAGLSLSVVNSPQVVPESQFSQTLEPHSSLTNFDQLFPRQNTVQARWNQEHLKSDSPSLERNDSNASSVRNSSQFNTSTPKPKSLSTVSQGDTPPSRAPRGRRTSFRLAKPRDLSSEFASPESSSVGRALADFFSSPENASKEMRNTLTKGKKTTTASSVKTSDGDEPKLSVDALRITANGEMSVCAEVKDTDDCETVCVSRNPTDFAQGGENVGETQNDIEETEKLNIQAEIRDSSSSLGNVSDVSVDDKEKTSATPERASNSVLDHTPRRTRTEILSRTRTPDNLSPIVAVTPPSILRRSGKRSQNSRSEKRVRFLDCLEKLADTPQRKRDKPNPVVNETDEASASSIPMETVSGGTGGTEMEKDEASVKCAARPQDPRNGTVKTCEEAPQETRSSVTPQSTAQKPTLRIGLRKTPRFLYPSSSQIQKTCPQKVFTFSATGQQQPVAKAEHHQGESKRVGHPARAENMVNSPAIPETKCPPELPSTHTTTKPLPAVDADMNSMDEKNVESNPTEIYKHNSSVPSVESVVKNSTTLYEDTSLSSVLLEENEHLLEEEPDWSDLEDVGSEKSKTKVDDQQLKENLSESNNQSYDSIVHTSDKVCTDKSQLSLKQESELKQESNVSVSNESESFRPSHIDSPYPKPCEQKESSFASGMDSAVTFDSEAQKPLPASKSGAEHVEDERDRSVDDQFHAQDKTTQADDQEDLQSELLFGVDFSQELLSQSKSCFPLSVEKEDTDKCGYKCVPPKFVETSQLNLLKETDRGDIHPQDSDNEAGVATTTHAPKKDAETFTITEEPKRRLKTVKPVQMSLKQKKTSQLRKLGAGPDCQKSSDSAEQRPSKPEGQRQSCSADSSFQIPDACTGFMSAAGRLLQPTEKALASAKDFFEQDMFGDFDDVEEKAPPHEPENLLQSDVSLTKGNDSHSESNYNSTSEQSQGNLSVCVGKPVDVDNWAAASKVCGFKTASGKDFTVSSKHQKKAANMWQAVLKETQTDGTMDNSTDPDPRTVSDLTKADHAPDKFSGPHAEKENITDKLEKTPTALDAVSEDTNVACQKTPLETFMKDGSTGFKTAVGKEMHLSSKSQKKAVDLWNSVEGELKSVDGLQDGESVLWNTGNSPSPDSKNVTKSVRSSCGEMPPKVLSAEKPVVSSKSVLHLAQPASSVPQGFRPFKAPQIIKTVSEEERYTTKIPECPVVHPKNTLLHHYSQVKVTSKSSEGTIKDCRGSKRKHSDEFSDDEDMWGVENMDDMLNSGFCHHRDNQSGGELSTSKLTHVSDTNIGQNTPKKFSSRKASVELDLPQNERSSDQNHSGATSPSAENLNNGPEQVMHVQNTDRLEHGDNKNDGVDMEEMSEAVMSDLSHEMYEVNESTSRNSCKVPTEPCETAPTSACLKDSEEKDGQTVNLRLPPQDSTKSVVNRRVSFESMRCDENVSFDDEDFPFSHAVPGDMKTEDGDEHDRLVQADSLDLKEADFDSTIPDPTADPAFETHEVNQADDDCDNEIQSSFVEKDFTDISRLEKELDSSHVEVSGGVVWTDGNDDNETKEYSVLSTLLHSLDAMHEEKHDQLELVIKETEDAFNELRHDIRNIEDVFGGEDGFENEPVSSDVESMQDVHTAERKTELGELTEKAQSQSSKWKQPDVRDRPDADVHGTSVFENQNDRGEADSAEDSLCNVSWSDITSTLNLSQWGDVKICKPDAETADCGEEGLSQGIDACGDSNTHLPFTAYSKPLGIPERETPRGVTDMSNISSKVHTISNECDTSMGEEKVSDAGTDVENPCTDSEGFQVTADMLQTFSSQASRTATEQVNADTDFERNKPEPSLSVQGFTSGQFQKRSLPQVGFGFQTAAGKYVGVSAKSLDKVKHLFASEMGSAEDSDSLASLVFLEEQSVCFRTVHEAAFRDDSTVTKDTAESKHDPEIKSMPKIKNDQSCASDQPLAIPGETVCSRTSSDKTDHKLGKNVCLETRTDHHGKNLGETCHSGARPGDSSAKSQHAEKVSQTKSDELDLGGVVTVSDKASHDGGGRTDPSVPQGGFPGFQTAGGSRVTVSKKALARARSVLSAEDNPTDCVTVSEQNRTSKHMQEISPETAEFHTLKEEMAAVSAEFPHNLSESLSAQTFSACEKKDVSRQKDKRGMGHTGFQTASGGKVSVSARSLLHARHVLSSAEDGNEADGKNKKTLDSAGLDVTNTRRQSEGFETAGGRLVSVSEHAVRKARKMLDSSERDKDLNLTGSGSSHCVAATTSGKMMDSSETKTHISLEPEALEDKLKNQAPERGLCGFQTAGGKSVTVSSKALLHAHSVLRDDENPKLAQRSEEHTPTQPKFAFHTASGSAVSISAKALKHAHGLFQDHTDLQSMESPMPAKSDSGLSTESTNRKQGLSNESTKRKHSESSSESSTLDWKIPSSPHSTDVSISSVGADEGALLHQNVQNLSEAHAPTQPKLAFHTASGSAVSISAKALKHAHGLFQGDTDLQSMEGPIPGSTHAPDCDLPQSSEQAGRERGRRSKEDLRPVVSDDSREMVAEEEEDGENSGVTPSKTVEQGERPRMAVKRRALCADSEAILHDRSAKRFKLQPLTAHDKVFRQPPAPFTPPKPSDQSKRSAPKCSFSAKPVSSFQPPYKKPKFSPPEAKHSPAGADSDSSQKPKFNPPPLVKSSDGVTDNTPSPHPDASNIVPASSKGEDHVEKAKECSVNQEMCKLVTEEETDANADQAKSSTEKTNRSKSTSQAITSEQQGVDESDRREESVKTSGHSDLLKSAMRRSMAVEEARMRQEKIIRQKKRQKIKPVQGRWLAQKSTQKSMKLADLGESTEWRSRKELQHLGVSPAVCSVSSSNAEEFRFYLPSFYPRSCAGILVGDGALLVPDAHGYAGKEEFFLGLVTVEGVDPGLVTEGWLYNHYRWVVWKLAAYEVALPHTFAARTLTPDTVMYQLKYRYDREVDCCHRSALKRIVERDDTPCKRLVLCISGIKTVEDSDLNMLEVTDGWYCLPCKPDSVLQALIDRGRVGVGHKVVISGAELAGSQEPCSPLELCAGLHLKVSGNSLRRAGGGARLGYQPDPRPLCVPLASLHPRGGLVGCVDVVVVRKYPLMFMEKLAQGGCVFRTAEMEERVWRKQEDQRQTVVEKLCSQLQTQMEKEETDSKRAQHKRSLGKKEVESLTSGAEISDAMDTVPHPEELQSMLSSSQMEELLVYRARQREERQQLLNERLQEALNQSSSEGERSVTPLQKFRIVGCCNRDLDSKSDVMVTVWRPGQDWDSVQEGKRYRLYSLTASAPRSQALGRSVELSAGRQTRLRSLRIEENLLDLLFEPREVSCVSDLQQKAVSYGEVDFVGLVISIKTALRGSDAVYAVDSKGDLILIWFWGGLKTFSLQDTLTEGTPFAASNLRLKSSAREVVECCVCLELSHFSMTGKTATHRQLLHPLRQRDWNQQLMKNGREKLSRIGSSFKPTAAPTTEQWKPLQMFFEEECKKDIKGKSEEEKKRSSIRTRVHDFLKRSTAKLYALFLSFAMESFDILNQELQTDAAKIHVVKRSLEQFYRKLLISFVKPSALSSGTLLAVDFTAKYNMKDSKNILIGTATKQHISGLRDKVAEQFMKDVISFYQAACTYLKAKVFPVGEPLWKHAQVADIKLKETALFSSLDYFMERFPCLLPHEVGEDESPQEALTRAKDQLQAEFTDYQSWEVPSHLMTEEKVATEQL
ncbi:hypothetical protein ACOMHN_058813 [Nucella lapillus]